MPCGSLSGLKYPIASLRIEHRWHLASEVAGDGPIGVMSWQGLVGFDMLVTALRS